jgi:DNA-binding MarR family transcriptional regulator
MSKFDPKTDGKFAYDGLDRLIHEKARLSIVASLAANEGGLVFNELKALCKLTDGNLSRQLQQLAEAELIEIWKGTRNNRPLTLAKLTPDGRKRFMNYVAVLESLVADVTAAKPAPAVRGRPATA